MSLDESLRRLSDAVGDLAKVAAQPRPEAKSSNQIDLFAAPAPANNSKPSVENTLMAATLDRTIERIENLLQAGSR